MARLPRCLAGPRSTSGPITLLDGNATSSAKGCKSSSKGIDLQLRSAYSKGPLIEEIKINDPANAEQNADRLSRTVLQLSYNRYKEYQLLNSRSSEIEKTLENEFKCNDTFHHLHRRPGMARGIESKTCLCREIRCSKKRKKKGPRKLQLLTKLPRQKRKKKRKRDAGQGLSRGLLDYDAPLPRQQQARLGTESTSPLNMLGQGTRS